MSIIVIPINKFIANIILFGQQFFIGLALGKRITFILTNFDDMSGFRYQTNPKSSRERILYSFDESQLGVNSS